MTGKVDKMNKFNSPEAYKIADEKQLRQEIKNKHKNSYKFFRCKYYNKNHFVSIYDVLERNDHGMKCFIECGDCKNKLDIIVHFKFDVEVL